MHLWIWILFFIAVLGGLLYTRRFKTLLFIAALYLAFPFSFWSYKLTLVVETPEGIKTGSAVRQVYFSVMPKILPEEHGIDTGVKGEAVAVDLGERGVLFSLLKGEDSYNIVFREFPYTGSVRSKIFHYTTLNAKKELTLDKIPMLVRFRDINDPKTVELVDPNDLEKTFGKGVKLISATLEMTDEDMTRKMEKVLPSWRDTGFAEWRAKLRYDQVIIDREDFERK